MSTFNINIQPQSRLIPCSSEENLLSALQKAGIPYITDCGGEGKCGRCQIRVLRGEYFTHTHHRGSFEEGWTLACLTEPRSALTVWLPEMGKVSLSFDKESLAKEYPPVIEFSSLVKRISCEVPPPNESDNSSDWARAFRALKKASGIEFDITLNCLRKLPQLLRSAHSTTFFISTPRNTIIDIDAENSNRYGLAIDLGTTTVEILLCDLNTGEILACAGGYNLQMAYGSDIIHRIISAGKKGNSTRLQDMAVQTIKGALKPILKHLQIKPEAILSAVISGNTTMIHLLLGIDPANIRLHPYVPVAVDFPILTANSLNLGIHPEAPVYIVPGISSYVGGDIVSGLSTLDFQGELILYMDLGTNGEIALGDGEWFTACACSCGPAFEGSGVSCGMRAGEGAIDRIRLDASGKADCSAIGGESARGICGSGLIDLLAELFRNGFIGGKGKFRDSAPASLLEKVGRQSAFKLNIDGERYLLLDEADIDNLIRTKAALFSGVKTLLKELSFDLSALERIIVAGNFGLHLDIENAITIGMLPNIARDKFQFIGNASLRGAYKALHSQSERENQKKIAGKITNIELSNFPGYNDEFIAACFLPHTDISLFVSPHDLIPL